MSGEPLTPKPRPARVLAQAVEHVCCPNGVTVPTSLISLMQLCSTLLIEMHPIPAIGCITMVLYYYPRVLTLLSPSTLTRRTSETTTLT